jgi:murein DD-endopeptidase MepM/ murein hydrolase activator NlpD
MNDFKMKALAASALCAVLGACTMDKPLYSVRTDAPAPAAPEPPPAPPPPVARDDGAPIAAPTQPIQSSALPPPPGAREAPARPAPPPYSPPPYSPPVMVAQRAPGSGPVRTETPAPVIVKKGDTLVSISHKTGIFVADLADENGLQKPYRLKLGSSIKLPTKRYYLVQGGDTLYAVARRFGLEPKVLADFNKIEEKAGLHSGQKVFLPAEAKDKGVPKPIMVAAKTPAKPAAPPPSNVYVQTYAAPQATPSTSVYARPAQTAPAPATAYTPPSNASAPPPVVAAARPPAEASRAPSTPPAPAGQTLTASDAEVAAAGRGVFLWPVRGEVIGTFGPRGAARNDGVDLGATQGDSVRSAAAGEVVYAGNAVQGFGNLVLIKHPGGWVTAYAHLANLEVKMRQQVTQGQEIGLVGQTGGVDRPQLHFEVRYAPTPKDKARPIDPMLVLPAGG